MFLFTHLKYYYGVLISHNLTEKSENRTKITRYRIKPRRSSPVFIIIFVSISIGKVTSYRYNYFLHIIFEVNLREIVIIRIEYLIFGKNNFNSILLLFYDQINFISISSIFAFCSLIVHCLVTDCIYDGRQLSIFK